VSGRIEGKVIAFGETGDLITDISAPRLQYAPRDERIRIRCDEHETIGMFLEANSEPEATYMAVLDDRGVLRLRIVGMSARELLGIRLGETVVVEW